jgi:hypothetical protein
LVKPGCDRRDRIDRHDLHRRLNVQEVGLAGYFAVFKVGELEAGNELVVGGSL